MVVRCFRIGVLIFSFSIISPFNVRIQACEHPTSIAVLAGEALLLTNLAMTGPEKKKKIKGNEKTGEAPPDPAKVRKETKAKSFKRADFKTEIDKLEKPILLHFAALETSEASLDFFTKLEKIALEHPEFELVVVHLGTAEDRKENKNLIDQYNVKVVPTTLILKDKKLLDDLRLEGTAGLDDFIKKANEKVPPVKTEDPKKAESGK